MITLPNGRRVRGLLFDLDGVIYRGPALLPGAAALLQALQARCIPHGFVTNHAVLTPWALSARLALLGLDVPGESFTTAAQAAADWLRQVKGAAVWPLGSPALSEALLEAGVHVERAHPTHVLIGLNPQVAMADIGRAATLIRNGAIFLGTNADVSAPGAQGAIEPECGFVLSGLQAMTGCAPLTLGKPGRSIFDLAARNIGCAPGELAMIGDRMDTDIAGAHAVGAAGILVLTGHTRGEDLASFPAPADFIVEDLNAVLGWLTNQ